MIKHVHLLYSLIAFMQISCYSYHSLPEQSTELDIQHDKERKTAYIIETDLEQELEILHSSKLFELTSDSTKADILVQVYPMKKRPQACGQALIANWVTLGQIPVFFNDYYIFQFDEIQNGHSFNHEIEFTVRQRVWFWDMFVFNKKFEKKAGESLRREYQKS